jgi:pyridoxine/pyridoxamine 5'-phosphate oxidase
MLANGHDLNLSFEVNMNLKLTEKAACLKEKHSKIRVPVPPGWGCAKALNLIHVKYVSRI